MLRPLSRFAGLLLLLLLAPAALPAQAINTATRSAELSVFAGWVGGHPDYGPRDTSGVSFGLDYTRFFHFPVAPALEFRGNIHSNYAVAEHSYLAGVRAAVPLRFARPYADFLVGPGTILFPLQTYYRSDNSIVYSYGGGVDVPVYRNFAFKADLQAQHWNTGEFTYTPTLLTLGVNYTIPFRPHFRERDYRR